MRRAALRDPLPVMPSTDDERLTEQVYVRLKPAEAAYVDEVARDEGRSRAWVVRQAVLQDMCARAQPAGAPA